MDSNFERPTAQLGIGGWRHGSLSKEYKYPPTLDMTSQAAEIGLNSCLKCSHPRHYLPTRRKMLPPETAMVGGSSSL